MEFQRLWQKGNKSLPWNTPEHSGLQEHPSTDMVTTPDWPGARGREAPAPCSQPDRCSDGEGAREARVKYTAAKRSFLKSQKPNHSIREPALHTPYHPITTIYSPGSFREGPAHDKAGQGRGDPQVKITKPTSEPNSHNSRQIYYSSHTAKYLWLMFTLTHLMWK